jgi:uncharacterized protein
MRFELPVDGPAERALALFSTRYETFGCLPPSPGSLRFHKRSDFGEVGENIFVPSEKQVIYMERVI